MRVLARWVAHVAVVAAVCGCARHHALTSADEAAQFRAPATLVVKNNNFSDMVVYALQNSGDPIRLGMVTSTSSGTFTLQPNLISPGPVRIFATPIGGNGRANSGPVSLSGGQTMTFTIQQDLAASSVLVQ